MSIPLPLIVEDQLLVRMVAVQIAEEAGFSVLQAADADEAIGVLKGRPDIRVVLTDIDMPGSMDGWNSPKLSDTAGRRSTLS